MSKIVRPIWTSSNSLGTRAMHKRSKPYYNALDVSISLAENLISQCLIFIDLWKCIQWRKVYSVRPYRISSILMLAHIFVCNTYLEKSTVGSSVGALLTYTIHLWCTANLRKNWIFQVILIKNGL